MLNSGLGLIAACVIGAALGACSERPAPTTGAAPAANTKQETTPAVGASAPAAVSSAPPGRPNVTPSAPVVAPPGATGSTPASPAPAEAPKGEPQATPSASAPAGVQMISVERAKQLYDAKEVDGKQVVFVDARIFLEFRDSGHIRGAMHYSKDYTRAPPQPKVRNYLPGSAVVIYCHGETCTDSIDVARYFESLKLDIGPIFIMKDGIPAFMKAYPDLIDKGNEVGFN